MIAGYLMQAVDQFAMTPSAETLIGNLLQSGLLWPEELQEVLAATEPKGGVVTEDALLDQLKQKGKLTSYQQTALQAGKADDLCFGNYLVLDRLGAGGMGTVYLAKHRRMKRTVAIKVLPRGKTKSAEQIAQFQQEIEAVARLSHPNIVTAHDADECGLGHFLVMEYVPGCDLAELTKKNGPLPLATAIDYIVQAARALEYAHSQGIVHCDVKPANMLLGPKNTVKIADLGLARFSLAVEAKAASGKEKSISGTLDFMSPEQAFDPQGIDHRSDIYSLGCSLFYLLTGQVLFDGNTVMEKLEARLNAAQRSLVVCRPGTPRALEEICQRMTAKEPALRYQSMTEVMAALEACPLPDRADQPELLASNTALAPTSRHMGFSITLPELSVLLVEPSRVQGRMIAAQLQELEIFRLQTASAGQQALAMMMAAQPDVVISSMHLPDMTGAELVQKMRLHGALMEVAFVLVSSESDHKYLEPVRQAGTAAILPKPFVLDGLRRALLAAVNFFSPHTLRVHNLNAAALRVLTVDDSRASRCHIRRVLENMGMSDILEAANGAQALDALQGNRFELVVSDYNMPDMDGPALTRHIRADRVHRTTPVLMITSESAPELLADARAAGVSAVCAKVFDPQTVCGILESILSRSQASVEA